MIKSFWKEVKALFGLMNMFDDVIRSGYSKGISSIELLQNCIIASNHNDRIGDHEFAWDTNGHEVEVHYKSKTIRCKLSTAKLAATMELFNR